MTDASAAYTRHTPVTKNPILASFNIHDQRHDPKRLLEHSCDHMVPQDEMGDYDLLHSHTQRDDLDVPQNKRCDRDVLHAHTQSDQDVVQDYRDGHDALHRHTQRDRDVVQDHRDGHDVLHRHTQRDRDVVQDHRDSHDVHRHTQRDQDVVQDHMDGHDVLHRHTQSGNNVDVLLNERCDRKVLHSQTGGREVLKGQGHAHNVVLSHTRGGHSYGAFHGDALVGVLFAGIQHSVDKQTPSEVHPPYTEQRSSIMEQKVNIFDHYGVTEALHIYRLAVHPDYTHQGLGFKLIKHTLDKARGMGIQCIYIWTSDDRTSELFEELEFDKLYEMKDKELLDDVGKPLFRPMSSNCVCTLYGKYYSDIR